MDIGDSRTVYVGYVPGRSGSVILWPFDAKLTNEMIKLELKYADRGLQICTVGNISMYWEYLPVLAETSTLDEFEQLIVEHFASEKTLMEQLEHNVDQYIKWKNGEPNSAKVIRMEFLELVEEVADKNSGAFETLAALEEAEKDDMPVFKTIDALFDELEDDDTSPN